MAYVYRHIRLDKNEPFYIGIGSDNNYGRARQKTRRNHFWNNIVNKTNYRIDILVDDISWEDAQKKEIEFIKLYGRTNLGAGTLSNLTDGGYGMLGVKMSKESIQKRIKTLKDSGYVKPVYLHTEESKLKISLANKGVPKSEETKEKFRVLARNRKVSEETRVKFANNMMGNKYLLGYKHSDSSKSKMAISQLNRTKKEGSSSVYRGVYFSKKDKCWVSRIKVNKKSICLGSYKNEADAALAYNKKAYELYGDLVVLNIIK